jgi:hypothetical protein
MGKSYFSCVEKYAKIISEYGFYVNGEDAVRRAA